jgi:hypothetical protein
MKETSLLWAFWSMEGEQSYFVAKYMAGDRWLVVVNGAALHPY